MNWKGPGIENGYKKPCSNRFDLRAFRIAKGSYLHSMRAFDMWKHAGGIKRNLRKALQELTQVSAFPHVPHNWRYLPRRFQLAYSISHFRSFIGAGSARPPRLQVDRRSWDYTIQEKNKFGGALLLRLQNSDRSCTIENRFLFYGSIASLGTVPLQVVDVIASRRLCW